MSRARKGAEEVIRVCKGLGENERKKLKSHQDLIVNYYVVRDSNLMLMAEESGEKRIEGN